jgi:hypothetical protein
MAMPLDYPGSKCESKIRTRVRRTLLEWLCYETLVFLVRLKNLRWDKVSCNTLRVANSDLYMVEILKSRTINNGLTLRKNRSYAVVTCLHRVVEFITSIDDGSIKRPENEIIVVWICYLLSSLQILCS